MIKCCIRDCEAAGIVSANHPNASRYCASHGICASCGESVEYFLKNNGRWLCPCVIRRIRENELALQKVVHLKHDSAPPALPEKKVNAFSRAEFDPTRQPNWEEHGFVRVNGKWRERKRYEDELKEAALAARGIFPPAPPEPMATWVPDPGHVMYSRDDLDRMGISMMDYMRQIDAVNQANRIVRGIDDTPVVPSQDQLEMP